MGSFDKGAASKPCLIFSSNAYVWELDHKPPLKGRRGYDNKGRVRDCETFLDRLSFLELTRKAKWMLLGDQCQEVPLSLGSAIGKTP